MPGRVTGWATPEERRAFGRSRRKQVHRVDLAHWNGKERQHDPLELLARSMRGRLPQLVAIKYQRMTMSPFGFFRGAVPVMAADLAQLPQTGIVSQLCGDAHVRNLGAFAAPDGRLLFDINDFDETTRGPFEWDGRRLAASLILAGREAGNKGSANRDAVRTFVSRYAQAIRMFSHMPVLEVARYQVHRLQRVQPVSKALLQAERSTPQHTLEQLTTPSATHGHRIFIEHPPLIVRMLGGKAREIIASLAAYRETLLPERRHFLDQYRPLDVALKVVGTGSVGTRCYVIYMQGNDEGDPLFLQLKEEGPSAYAQYLPQQLQHTVAHNGQRVADGQRAMQLSSDAMLGWTTIASRDYVVRQLNDHKGSITVEDMAGPGLGEYAEVCGELLARGHCRSGDACALNGYMGSSPKTEEALVSFAEAYADQTEKDWAELCKKLGVVPSNVKAKAAAKVADAVAHKAAQKAAQKSARKAAKKAAKNKKK
jgi:uncharacterized protein (DUF2252 family)